MNFRASDLGPELDAAEAEARKFKRNPPGGAARLMDAIDARSGGHPRPFWAPAMTMEIARDAR